MIRIVVASINPVKIAAVKKGFSRMFPGEKLSVEGVPVSSCVSHQPIGNTEIEKGALSRVKNARRERSNDDYWVGIEGGVEENGNDMNAFAWVIIESKDGKVGKGRTGTFLLPTKVAKLIKKGKELGEADDIVFGQTNSKQKMGAVGLLTHNVINRTTYYTHAVILALIRFKNEKMFHK